MLGRQGGWERTDQLFWVARPVRIRRWNTQLDNSVTVIYQIIMKGQRDCGWLLISSLNHCSKSCLGEYCKGHLVRIRRESPIPIPCRRCGKGPQSVWALWGRSGSKVPCSSRSTDEAHPSPCHGRDPMPFVVGQKAHVCGSVSP